MLVPILIVAAAAYLMFGSSEKTPKKVVMQPGERWKVTLEAGSVENRDQTLSILETVGAEVVSVKGPKAVIIMTNGADDFEVNVPGDLRGFPGVRITKAEQVE